MKNKNKKSSEKLKNVPSWVFLTINGINLNSNFYKFSLFNLWAKLFHAKPYILLHYFFAGKTGKFRINSHKTCKYKKRSSKFKINGKLGPQSRARIKSSAFSLDFVSCWICSGMVLYFYYIFMCVDIIIL